MPINIYMYIYILQHKEYHLSSYRILKVKRDFFYNNIIISFKS